MYNQWKKYIFNDKICSFNFIISKSNSLDEEQSKTLSEFWNKFKKHWINLQFNIQLIETTINKIKELLIGKNIDFSKSYISSITSVLRRNKKENDLSECMTPSYELDLNSP